MKNTPELQGALAAYTSYLASNGAGGSRNNAPRRTALLKKVRNDYSEEIAQRTLTITLDLLEKWGVGVSSRHQALLTRVCVRYAALLGDHGVVGRYPFGIDTGMAKSTTVIALIKTLYDMWKEGKVEKSLTVVAYQKVELAKLYEQAVSIGVDPAFLGMKYEKTASDVAAKIPAPLSDEDAANVPVLMVTQQRIYVSGKTADEAKKMAAIDMYATYKGKRRDLTIWDETLRKSEARVVDLSSVLWQRASFLEKLRRGKNIPPAARGAAKYLNEAVTLFEAEEKRQRKHRWTKAEPVAVPRVSPDIMDSYVTAVRKVGGNANGKRGVAVSALLDTLELCRNELLHVAATDSGAIVSYAITVPPELDKVVVLDASWSINKLMERDRSFIRDERFEKLRTGAKRYDNVTLTRIPCASGKIKFIEYYRKQDIAARLPSLEAADIINKDIGPDGGAFLLIVHKGLAPSPKYNEPGLDIPAILESDLKELCGPDIMSRGAITTYGKHRASNAYRDTPNVILLGMTHRRTEDVTGDAIGQADDTYTALNQEELNDIIDHETADTTYQGLSRGASRKVYVDKWGRTEAQTSRVWQLLHEVRPCEIVRDYCPGMTLTTQQPRHMPTAVEIEWTTVGVSNAILRFLETYQGRSISAKKLKTELGLTECTQKTWVRALKEMALYAENVGWTYTARSFRRIS